MDTPDPLWLETNSQDTDKNSRTEWEKEKNRRKTSGRRAYSERDRQSICEALSKTFRSDKEAWNDIRRRERMAEAMYEC